MSPEAIIEILLSVIGVLILSIVGMFIQNINRQLTELADMFRRHVRNSKIHVNMDVQPEGV